MLKELFDLKEEWPFVDFEGSHCEERYVETGCVDSFYKIILVLVFNLNKNWHGRKISIFISSLVNTSLSVTLHLFSCKGEIDRQPCACWVACNLQT